MKKYLLSVSLPLSVTTVFILHSVSQNAPFPAKTPGVDIAKKLDNDFEPSGGAWHPRTDKIFVVSDDGRIAQLNSTGSIVKVWALNGNWEGVAITGASSNNVYVVDEIRAQIREFNFVTGNVSNRIFNLSTAVPGPGVAALSLNDKDALMDEGDGMGAEALTFVPDSNDSEGGLFFVGSQENGTIYKFRLSLSSGSRVTYVGKVKNWTSKDLAGLEYDWNKGNIFAVWDAENKFRILKTDGTILKEWTVPAGSKDEEGLAFDGSSLYISEDTSDPSPIIRRYDSFKY